MEKCWERKSEPLPIFNSTPVEDSQIVDFPNPQKTNPFSVSLDMTNFAQLLESENSQ